MGDAPRPDDATESLGATESQIPGPLKTRAPGVVDGTVIGRYLVLGPLGRGGMGAVYAAYDPRLDRKVALKLLHAQGAAFLPGGLATQRLEREAQALARLSHPNIVAVHDVGTHEGKVFIAMELIDGQTLKSWLLEESRTAEEVLSALRQAGEGLAAIHGAGLVHRDFKAANVVVARDGRVKVLDFGLARLSDDHTEPAFEPSALPHSDMPSPLETPLTVDGQISGTPGYVAPELLEGAPPSPASDQFAFGVTLHSALYGVRPWPAESFQKYASELRLGPPTTPPPGTRLPRWLFPIVRRALAAKPEDRFPSMRALLDALGRDPARRRRQVAMAGAALALSVLASWGGLRAVRGDCATSVVLLNGLWPLAARGELRETFVKARPDAAAQIDKALALLDERLSSWADAHEKACKAATRRSATPVELARMTCLKRRGDAAETLLSVLRQGDPTVAAKSEELVDFFTSDLSCADQRALNRLAPDDVPPEKLAVARELRSTLLRARALQSLDRGTEGLELARAVATRAREEGLAGFEGEAMYRAAYFEAYLGEDENALRDYRRSVYASLEAGVDERALWAAVKVTRKIAKRDGASKQAVDMLELCETLLKRLGNDPKLEVDVIDAREAILNARGELEAMTALNRRRVEVARLAFGEKHLDTAQAMVDLANALFKEGRVPESIETEEKATALIGELQGRDWPNLTLRYLSLGISYGDVGRDADALATLEKGLELAERALEPNDTTIADLKSSLASQLEGVDEQRALKLATEALARYERSKDAPDLYDALLSRARPLAALGQGRDALVDCERAELVAAPLADPLGTHKRSVALCRGRALLADGRPKEALEAFTAARDVLPPSRLPRTRARIALGLARALAATGAPEEQVRAAADEAKALFRIFPALARLADEVDAAVVVTPRPAKRTAKR